MLFLRAIDEPPEGLFKFRPLRNDTDRQGLTQLLTGHAYFPTFSQFNDPFEGRMKFVAGDPETFHSRLLAHSRRVALDRGLVPPTEVFHADPEEFAAHLTGLHQDRLRNDNRYFCLAGTRASPLLWSHYADSHRGVCVVFGIKTHPFGHALKVDYELEFPTQEAVSADSRDQGELLRKSVLTKADYWDYEHEFRLLSIRGENPAWHLDCPWSKDKTTLRFDYRCIVSVTLGAAISDEERKGLLEFLAKCPTPVRVDQASIRSDQYGLTFSTIEI